ncbi:MAG: sigma-70 family RNA polymerase sigma factor [Pirellulaceae bacterium]
MSLQPFDPEAAIRAARLGDPQAVAALIGHYRPYLRLLAKVCLGKRLQSKLDESDLVQEASFLAARDMVTFRGTTEAEFAVWLRAILANSVANVRRHFEQQRRDLRLEHQWQVDVEQSSADFAQLVDHQSSPSQQAARRERVVLLAEALDRLESEQREVITMRDLEGCSLAEIADRLGKSRNAVQKIWARGISELRRVLKALS